MTMEGEVSNFRPPNASGHLYFSLSDATAKINVAFFAYRQRLQGKIPTFTNGDKVRVQGSIALYAPNGSYHFNVEHLEICDGTGELLLRFEKLKRQLFAEGLCDASRKRPLPQLPKRIGIVTAPTGAAIRDILNILSRRFPNLHIIIAPCRVQGADAAKEITAAIRLLNRHFAPGSGTKEPMDAMIVGRGGGSLEELWCFNEECVARAVAESSIPVISAVGHEPDIAITDFVADLRAPTPSAAAELICGRKEDFVQHLSIAGERLIKALRVRFVEARNHVRHIESSALFRDPIHLLEKHAQSVDARDNRLTFAMEAILSQVHHRHQRQQFTFEHCGVTLFSRARERLEHLRLRMESALQDAHASASERLVSQTATLKAVDPTAVLNRGYALITDEDGTLVTDAEGLAPGDHLRIRLAKAVISATFKCKES